MSLTTKIKNLLAAAGFATLAACSTTPSPVCSYNSVVDETQEQRGARLGHTIEDGCEELVPGHNDIRQRRINIVYVGVNYTPEDFLSRIRDGTDCRSEHRGLLATEPMHSNLENFNFWYVSKMEYVELSETVDGLGREAVEPGLELAKECNLPNRTIFIMANWGFRSNASFPEFAGIHFEQMDLRNLERYQDENRNWSVSGCQEAVDNYCLSLNISDRTRRLCDAIEELRGRQDPSLDRRICTILVNRHNVQFGISLIDRNARPSTLVHEAGHQIYRLTDEYVEDGQILPEHEAIVLEDMRRHSHNCFPAPSREACLEDAPWEYFVPECYQGCGLVMELDGVPVWRSANRATMYYTNAGNFGLWNELRACQVIDVVTHNAAGYCQQFGFGPRMTPRGEPGEPDVAGHNQFLMETIDESVE